MADTAERHAAYAEPGAGDIVLLIEDDEDIATMYATGLNLSGHHAHIASSGQSGLSEAIVAEEPPSVIVLDLGLPDMPGLELLDNLRGHTPPIEIPVIVLSNDSEDFDVAYEHGATECHQKYRTTPRQLVGYVEHAIRERRLSA